MDAQALDRAAQAIYETLAAKGHGPRPWAAHTPNAQPWTQLPERWRDEYRQAARLVLEQPLQQTLPV